MALALTFLSLMSTLLPQSTMGMFSQTRTKSRCQFGTFLYVTLEVTSNMMMAQCPGKEFHTPMFESITNCLAAKVTEDFTHQQPNQAQRPAKGYKECCFTLHHRVVSWRRFSKAEQRSSEPTLALHAHGGIPLLTRVPALFNPNFHLMSRR